MDEVADAVPCQPWRPEDGEPPTVRSWPYGEQPALWIRHAGHWRWGTVLARQDWPGGRSVVQVSADLTGAGLVTTLTYAWPQSGLRPVARRG